MDSLTAFLLGVIVGASVMTVGLMVILSLQFKRIWNSWPWKKD